MYYDHLDFDALVGKTLTEVKETGNEIRFYTTDGDEYLMYHCQDCCESVRVEDVCGEWDEIIGSPILRAEENRSRDWRDDVKEPEYLDSFTWTFYRITTMKGQVVIRWLGESNGYYSEEVDFSKVE